MKKMHDQLGELVGCEACTSTWVSFFISALNLLIIPSVAFTPFNLLLGSSGFWWLIILLDGLFGSGITWMLFRIEDALVSIKEKNQTYEDELG
jgi:Na+-driven multidrug efflux pump